MTHSNVTVIFQFSQMNSVKHVLNEKE